MEPEKLAGRSMNAHFQMLSISRTANPADQVCRKQAGGETHCWRDNSAQYGAPRLLRKCSQYLHMKELGWLRMGHNTCGPRASFILISPGLGRRSAVHGTQCAACSLPGGVQLLAMQAVLRGPQNG